MDNNSEKDKSTKINPLYIKDADWVMTNLTINSLIIYFVMTKMEESELSSFIVNITLFCSILGIIFGLIICAGWLVAVYTQKVLYIEANPKKKGKDNGSNNN